MISVAVSQTGFEIVQRLDRISPEFWNAVEEKMNVITSRMEEKVRANLSGGILQTKSGALLGSVKSGVERQGSMLIGYVEIDPPNETVKQYALAHEYGGKGYYWIHVGKKGFLANREDDFFSRRDVFHPPAKESRYLRSVLDDMNALEVSNEILSAVKL